MAELTDRTGADGRAPRLREGRDAVDLGPLVVCALALELVLLAGFTEQMNVWQLARIVTSPRSLAAAMGLDFVGALRFILPAIAAFVTFALAFAVARQTYGRRAVALVLGVTALYSLTLLPINPLGAHDVYHDVADARTFWLYHQNPALVAPAAHPHDWFTPLVPSWQHTASAYGPLWYALSGIGLPFSGHHLWLNVVAQKALTAAFLLGLTGLVMLIAQEIDPRVAVSAGVLVGWNPLLQFETAGNAHNDVVMALFAAAAFYAVARRWWLAVFPLLALSFAVKPVLAVLGPVLLVYLLRRRDVARRQLALSLVLGAIVALALFGPFFHGVGELAGLGRESDHVTSSPGALVHTAIWELTRINGLRLLRDMRVVCWPSALFVYGWALQRMRADNGLEPLVRTAFWVAFVFLVALTWWFMPWYLFWIVPFAAPLPGKRPGWIVVAFCAGALLSYAPHFWLLNANPLLLAGTTTACAFVPPLVVLLLVPGDPRGSRRTRPPRRQTPAFSVRTRPRPTAPGAA